MSQADYLVYGHKGYFGSHIVKNLELQGRSYATPNTRIENRESLSNDFDLYQPKWVICASGLAGNPNIVCYPHLIRTILAQAF